MNKYEDGREDCLASCRIYGMTACEWDIDDGECWAHTKKVVFGETSRVTFCYIFNQDKPVHGIEFSSEEIKFCSYILFIDCAHSKFGSTLTSNRQPSKVNYVASSSECAHSCNFWSFEGINITSDTTYLHHLWSRVYQDKLCLRKVLQV